MTPEELEGPESGVVTPDNRGSVSHEELVERAERWLRTTRRCGVVLTERSCASTGEIPDAIGWAKSYWSTLVECKVSRADFLKDKKKLWRFSSDHALGQRRFYLTPPGLIDPSELPEGWGLIEVRGSRCKVVREATETGFNLERCRLELGFLYSFARRAQLGIEPTVGCLASPATDALELGENVFIGPRP